MPATVPVYPPTYYAATAEALPLCPPLRGRRRVPVCVVGGGIAGCSAALALAERGQEVVLLEAQRLGWGASGRSGGQVLPGVAIEQPSLERLAGARAARLVWEASVAALRLLEQRIAQHGIDCEWVHGQMYAAVRPRQWRALQAWHRQLESHYGYAGTRLLDGRALRDILRSDRYLGALYDPQGGHLHPLRYTLGLARAALAAGVQIYEGSRALSFVARAGRLEVATAEGLIDCEQLLFAGNAWLGATVPPLARMLMAITSHVIVTEPLGEPAARRLIANDAAVCDTNWVVDYFRRSRDHRLIFGGGVSYSGLALRSGARVTRRRMLRTFPQLARRRIDYAWSCRVDITRTRAPHFGRLAPNVYFLQGFAGHGLALAGMAGTLVAEAMVGSAGRFDVFARIPHRGFPGGRALRRPLLMLGMLWYRLRDLL